MKKIVALVTVGAFLVGFGLLMRTYAYPRLAVVPSNLDSKVVAQTPADQTATYFSIADLAEKSQPLKNVSSARVDAALSKKASSDLGQDVLVISSYACTDKVDVDCQTIPLPLSGALSTFAIDERTGYPVTWAGASNETGGAVQTGVKYEGLTIKFPFNTQKKSYEFWNGDLNKTVPVRYVDETKLKGLKVYRFRQVLEPTVASQLDLPGTLVGSNAATVTADRVVSGRTDYFVEPETGVIMSAVSKPNSYATVEGKKVLTITAGTFESPDDAIDETIEEYKGLSTSLFGVRVLVPIVGIGLGAALLLVAVALFVRRNRRRPLMATRRRASDNDAAPEQVPTGATR